MTSTTASLDFIRQIVSDDLQVGRNGGRVITRFPPEPNGFLHIGHAKALCLNFSLPQEFADRARVARCHLRFDDTNPTKEERRYAEAMRDDIRWLGFEWQEHEYYASDYFEQLYEWAKLLVQAGKAYVDDQSAEDIRINRGTLTEPGRPSPFRARSAAENLDLLERMRAGEFPDGSRVLRAKIDMASPNVNLRDPVMYRILHATHPHTGETWCIYPMYDWAHGQSDWIEGITHSLCSLEFEDHRPLYDWFIEQLAGHDVRPNGLDYRPRQYEFARLNLSHTIVTKRKLRQLVEEGLVRGWDDPRMPTLSAMRRRGYPPAAIRDFCAAIGVAKRENLIPLARLEHHVREHLNREAERRMAVLNPLKVVIENFPEGQIEELEAVNNPEDESAGTRKVPFTRTIYIEKEDFMEEPPGKYFRLAPGREVRLRWGYFVKYASHERDAQTGEVTEVRCTYDPETRGGSAPDGRKVKGTLHWVSATHSVAAEVRLYEPLLSVEDPSSIGDGVPIREHVSADSLVTLKGCRVEQSFSESHPGEVFQFERVGYFSVDPDSREQELVFNRTVALRDTWAKIAAKQE